MLLDVKIYEVENTRTRVIGVQLPQTTTVFNVPSELNSVISGNSSLVQQIISSGLASAGDYAAIAAILIASGEVGSSILSQPFATFGNGLTLTGLSTGGITGNLSLNAADTRSLDQVQLRLDDNAEGTIRSGTRYPITTSSYSSIAASSVSIPGITTAGLSSVLSGLGVSASSLSTAAPIPQVQYQDLGLTLKVTPRIERNDRCGAEARPQNSGAPGRQPQRPAGAHQSQLIPPISICAAEPVRWWWATFPGRNPTP